MAEQPRSRAERSAYAETSTYEDVVQFLAALEGDPRLVRLAFGPSHEGRALPLVVASDARVGTPAEARALGRPVLFVMANIHAGEVEGKEACLHLLRRMAGGDLAPLLTKAVVLVAPIYNADGNERFGPQSENRPEQHGPERVGTRANAQGLDLNRDYVKLESPEARSLVADVLRAWDPHLVMDCHATDGTFHGYGVTWSPPLRPAEAGPVAVVLRDVLEPVRRRLLAEGLPTFPYGNLADAKDPSQGWRTFDARPRYGNSYVGLANRLCVLVETYSHDDFRTRVRNTERFVAAVLDAAADLGERLLRTTADADAAAAASRAPIGVAFGLAPAREETVLLRDTPRGPDRPVRVPVFDAFRATRTVPRPAAYLLDPSLSAGVGLLRRHGIRTEPLPTPRRLAVEAFRLLDLHREDAPFQGHRTVALTVERTPAERVVPAGWVRVPLAQPLGHLAATLLDPETDDGLVTWNLLDHALAPLTPGTPTAWLPLLSESP
jgi:hypothetical protein